MDYTFEHHYNEGEKCWMIALTGEIDIFNSEKVKSDLIGLINTTAADLRIDCQDLEYIDSTALGVLVAVLKNVKAYDGAIYLVNVRPNLAKLFKITNLDKAFILEADTND